MQVLTLPRIAVSCTISPEALSFNSQLPDAFSKSLPIPSLRSETRIRTLTFPTRLPLRLISRTASSCHRTCSECSLKRPQWIKMPTLQQDFFRALLRNLRMPTATTQAFPMVHTAQISILLEATLVGIHIEQICPSTPALTGKQILKMQAI